VFDAWLDRHAVAKFMFRDEEMVRLSLDPRVGGAFSFVVRRQGQEFDHIGHYLEIGRPRRLAFSWGVVQAPTGTSSSTDMSRVSIDIVALPTGCELTLAHEMHPDWADHASRAAAGWTKILDALGAVLG
jgi:uncharacterized protein YndB with AHSA1/START domain